MATCEVCGKEGKIEKHHLCYKENKMIPVCHSCHQKIHHTTEYPQYKPEDHWEFTFILAKRGTAQQLKQTPIAEFGDSYDDILVKLLKLDKKK